MTTVADQLTAFLETDLGGSGTITSTRLDPRMVYQGQGPRSPRARLEVKIRHLDRKNLGAKTGKLRRHEVELEIYSGGVDKTDELELSGIVRALADEIVDRFDGAQGGLAIFRAALPSLRFERAAAARRKVATGKAERSSFVDLAIDIWE